MHIFLLKCPHVQIAFLKFTSCDDQALVGCIPIAAVAVHLKLKSWKLVSHLMYSNNIVNFQESTTILNACKKVWKLIEGATYKPYVLRSTDLYLYRCRIVQGWQWEKQLFVHLSFLSSQGCLRWVVTELSVTCHWRDNRWLNTIQDLKKSQLKSIYTKWIPIASKGIENRVIIQSCLLIIIVNLRSTSEQKFTRACAHQKNG